MPGSPSHFTILKNKLRREPLTWLVTGVAGFIGSHLLEELLGLDQHVVGLDNFATGHRGNVEDVLARTAATRGSFRFIEADIRDANACLRACEGTDVVLHQAALGSVPRSLLDPGLYHDVNVNGFVQLCIAARDAGVRRFVYASSSAVYGDHPGLPKKEQSLGKPLSPYALTKRAGEMYAELFRASYGLECVGLRYFNVFGRRQDPHSAYAAVIPRWVARLSRGEPCHIHGDGETTRDFCFIANVVQANLRAAVEPLDNGEQVFNVGLGGRTSLNELYRILQHALARRWPDLARPQPVYDDFRPGDVRHSQADISRIRAALRYEPTHTLAEGLEGTLEWYMKHLAGQPAATAA
ncbi:MAG: SDR family oxidoreductase [Longimicrobiales bacterium]